MPLVETILMRLCSLSEEIEHKITGIVWRTEPVQGVKSPVATFVFHYRSKGTICTVLTNRGCTLTDCNQLLLRTF